MAHYAELSPRQICAGPVQGCEVVNVIVVGNEHESPSSDPHAQEVLGLAWLAAFPPAIGKTYRKTSFNAAENGFRKHYAGKGYIYDERRNAFIPPYPGEG